MLTSDSCRQDVRERIIIIDTESQRDDISKDEYVYGYSYEQPTKSV